MRIGQRSDWDGSRYGRTYGWINAYRNGVLESQPRWVNWLHFPLFSCFFLTISSQAGGLEPNTAPAPKRTTMDPGCSRFSHISSPSPCRFLIRPPGLDMTWYNAFVCVCSQRGGLYTDKRGIQTVCSEWRASRGWGGWYILYISRRLTCWGKFDYPHFRKAGRPALI